MFSTLRRPHRLMCVNPEVKYGAMIGCACSWSKSRLCVLYALPHEWCVTDCWTILPITVSVLQAWCALRSAVRRSHAWFNLWLVTTFPCQYSVSMIGISCVICSTYLKSLVGLCAMKVKRIFTVTITRNNIRIMNVYECNEWYKYFKVKDGMSSVFKTRGFYMHKCM